MDVDVDVDPMPYPLEQYEPSLRKTGEIEAGAIGALYGGGLEVGMYA